MFLVGYVGFAWYHVVKNPVVSRCGAIQDKVFLVREEYLLDVAKG